VKCQAELVLSPEDWEIIGFYSRVQDQCINQNAGGTPFMSPRLEGYEAAARIYGYDERDRRRLIEGALMLHRLVQKIDVVNWPQETGKDRRALTYEDFRGD
jgi:hypothetical protein